MNLNEKELLLSVIFTAITNKVNAIESGNFNYVNISLMLNDLADLKKIKRKIQYDVTSLYENDIDINSTYPNIIEKKDLYRLATLGLKVESGEIRTCMLKDCRVGYSKYVKNE